MGRAQDQRVDRRMKYIAGFVTGVFLGITGATVYYVLRALDELDDMDVSPQFSDMDLAQIFNFPTNKSN